MLEAGMRVHVPFGKGGRLIQGLIVGLADEKAEDLAGQIGELKDIAEVLDFRPFSMRSSSGWLTSCASLSFLIKFLS